MDVDRSQTAAEELVNTLTHGAGAVLGLAGLAYAAVDAVWLDSPPVVVGALVAYTFTVVALFGVSAGYHAVRDLSWKARLQKADHCAIYLLIAGTYTPFALVGLGGATGLGLLAAVWGLAVVGIGLELAVSERWQKVSLGLYLTMGWIGLLAAVPLVNALPLAASALVLLGGVLYTVGVPFYTRNRAWDHAVWHGFVLGGAVSHGAAVALCVA